MRTTSKSVNILLDTFFIVHLNQFTQRSQINNLYGKQVNSMLQVENKMKFYHLKGWNT